MISTDLFVEVTACVRHAVFRFITRGLLFLQDTETETEFYVAIFWEEEVTNSSYTHIYETP